ncbi:MAG: glycerol-3-phosphate 1-O-acyltransferase PlsY [Planctomycetota bacterium]|jgi:glycerol-3-phosphate acyltransferase PlsY
MINDPLILFLVLPLAAYVIGSTPFGVIIARSKNIDLRKHGSGNVGATNVGRIVGAKWGFLCLALDALKGAVPVLVVGLLLGICGWHTRPSVTHQAAWMAVGMAAILGHVLSFWLKFRGGKGVATGLGVVLAMWPYFTVAAAGALLIWIIVTLSSRYVSIGSMLAAILLGPLFVEWNWVTRGWSATVDLWPMGVFASLIGAVIIIRHRSNIANLRAGTEGRLGQPACPKAEG